MKQLRYLLLLLLPIIAQAQDTGSLEGTVLDGGMQQEPLMMATVTILETQQTTNTNFHGRFSFEALPEGEYTVVFSFLGYEKQAIPVRLSADSTVRLQPVLQQKTPGIPSQADVVSGMDKDRGAKDIR